MKRDAPIAEIDIGALSPDEQEIAEPESQRRLRESLQDQHYEAQHMRLWFENALQAFIHVRQVPEWDTIQSFATWKSREHYFRMKLEEMGWPL